MFPFAFEHVLAGQGVRVIRTPLQAPKANAHAERWVGSARRECFDWIIIRGRRHAERVLGEYVDYYNRERPHRGLQLHPPNGQVHGASAKDHLAPEAGGLAPRVLTRADLGGCMNTCTGHRAVKVLTDRRIETFESCEGGQGHSMPEPRPLLRTPGGGLEGPVGVLAYGLPVLALRRYWTIEDGEPVGPSWELVFRHRLI